MWAQWAVNHSIEGLISDPVALPAGKQVSSIAYLAQENCVHGCLGAEPVSQNLSGIAPSRDILKYVGPEQGD